MEPLSIGTRPEKEKEKKKKKAKYIHQHRYQTENRIFDNFKTDADCYRNKTGRTGWVFLTPLEETLNH
jgi:hypothetical protein